MNTNMMKLMAVAAAMGAAVMGCGRSEGTTNLGPADPGPAAGQGTAGKTTPIELRVLGVHGEAYSQALVSVSAVEVSVDGQRVPADVSGQVVDLANANQAWKVATAAVPEGAKAVQFTVRFDEYGGYASSSGSGDLDLRSVPISVTSPAASLARNGRAVILLDLSRSFVRGGSETRQLLPHYDVAY